MRIALMAHNLRLAGGLSVGRNVVATLRRVADRHEFFLVLPEGVGYESIELPTRSRAYFHKRRPALRQVYFDIVTLERMMRESKPDLIWGLGNFGLKNPGVPQAVHYFDAHLVYDPREQPRQLWHNGADMILVRWRLKRCLPNTRMVICQTQTMRDRFRKTFDYRGEMAIMPTAVSRYALAEQPARPKVFDELDGKFPLLALTRYYKHKNLEILAEMFQAYGDRLKDVVVLLTFDPKQGYGADKFVELINDPKIRHHFVNVGPVPQTDLAGYFRNCRGLIFPTVLESFSSTHLEAMQFDTPILTSDLDFAREVCGDAALYFDPFHAESVCQAILRLKSEPALAARLAAAGREHLSKYVRTWDDIVGEAIGRLEKLAAGAAK